MQLLRESKWVFITRHILDNDETFILGLMTNGELSKEVNSKWSKIGATRNFGSGLNRCYVSLENFKDKVAWKRHSQRASNIKWVLKKGQKGDRSIQLI